MILWRNSSDPNKQYKLGPDHLNSSKESMNQRDPQMQASFNEKNKPPIEAGFFESQKKFLISLLNSYGIVEDGMTRNIVETL